MALLGYSGALEQSTRTLALPLWLVFTLAVALFVVGGALYGRLFMRAANDFRGGWLFGIGFGFLLWMLGPATILQWLRHKPLALGAAAQAMFLAHLAYGLALGALFPILHRRLMQPTPEVPHPVP